MKQRRRPARRSPIRAPARQATRRTPPSTSTPPTLRATPTFKPSDYQAFEPRSPTQIDREVTDAFERTYERTLLFCHREVWGAPDLKLYNSYTRNGGEPVCVGDFGGMFDYLAPDSQPGEPIKVETHYLLTRHEAIEAQARKREQQAAQVPLALKQNMLVNGVDVPGGRHPSAVQKNAIKKSVERLSVPADGPKLEED
jgi:hypothetical protein